MPISVPFHSLTEKQEVRAANSVGSFSLLNPNIWFQRRKKKTEWNCHVQFNTQGVILLDLSLAFPLRWVCAGCQHVLWHKGLVCPSWNCHPHLFAAAVLQVVSRHKTSCSCLQNLLPSEITSPSYSLTVSCALVKTPGTVILYPVNSQKWSWHDEKTSLPRGALLGSNLACEVLSC